MQKALDIRAILSGSVFQRLTAMRTRRMELEKAAAHTIPKLDMQRYQQLLTSEQS